MKEPRTTEGDYLTSKLGLLGQPRWTTKGGKPGSADLKNKRPNPGFARE